MENITLQQRLDNYRQGKNCTLLCVGPMSKNCVDATIELADQAREECEHVFKWMLGMAKHGTTRKEDAQALIQSANYIERIADISGQWHMHPWNQEKAHGISEIFKRFAKKLEIDEHDQTYVNRNLYLFKAPPSWFDEPPHIGDALRSALSDSDVQNDLTALS